MKICSFCKEEKDLNEFYKYEKKVFTRCKICTQIKIKLERKCKNCKKIFNPKGAEKGCCRECRFLIKVKKDEKCWEWLGSKTPNGYGTSRDGNETISAHRLSFELFNGKIPIDLCVCHSCDNRSCVNPEHLWLGTTQDNTEDKMKKGRKADKRGEKHHLAKLSEDDVFKIREMHVQGLKQCEIAKIYHVDNSSISNIIRKRNWSHI